MGQGTLLSPRNTLYSCGGANSSLVRTCLFHSSLIFLELRLLSWSPVCPQHLAQGMVFIISFSKYFLSCNCIISASTVVDVWNEEPLWEFSEM